MILPGQILLWAVVVTGFVGIDDFEVNLATTLTWFTWFGLVFVLVAITGRGWCAICPFAGMAEWIQRGRLWHGRERHDRAPGLRRPVPAWLSRYGYLPTAFTFGLLTWLEEYFRVAHESSPSRTSWTVLGIALVAVITFLVFERRSFCRYLCPFGGLIGALGAGAPLIGFRARDRRACRQCSTRDCLTGNERAYGCPWFNWPGGTDSNVNCGLCGECFRACPSDNVGLFVDRPFAGLARPRDRRADVGWTVAIISGLVTTQHLRTTDTYYRVDEWVTGLLGWPHGPNPVLFALVSAACTLTLICPPWAAAALLFRRPPGGLARRDDSFVYRATPFRVFFLPLAYAAVPLLAADFIAVGLLSFLQDSPKTLAAAEWTLGTDPDSVAWLLSGSLAGGSQVLAVQIAVLVVGTLASSLLAWRIVGAEAVSAARAPLLARVGAAGLMALAGALLVATYLTTNGQAG
jgi:NosR/NirI family nitrous oxide reductase transcriptional regulator